MKNVTTKSIDEAYKAERNALEKIRETSEALRIAILEDRVARQAFLTAEAALKEVKREIRYPVDTNEMIITAATINNIGKESKKIIIDFEQEKFVTA